MTILDLPPAERPRERLAEFGAAQLSSIELIAILLNSGTKELSALGLASALLSRFGSLEQLADATLQELLAIKGIGLAKAVKLQAAFHLFKRLRPPTADRFTIDSSEKAYFEISSLVQDEKTEVLVVLLRDVRKNLLHKEIIGRGTLNHLLVHPREIFYTAIRHRAHSLILAHNHPSGDPTPSHQDLEMTKILRSVGRIVGIELADHLIIGHRNRFYSFRENGHLDLIGMNGY